MEVVQNIAGRVITFGLGKDADVTAENIEFRGANSHFDILYKGRLVTDVPLHVPGLHNVKNALAATAATVFLGATPLDVKYGLSAFTGAERRFEVKGKYNGADVYDDYAHHPSELCATIDAALPLGYKRIVLAFQPHTYSRTKSLFSDFVEQLRRPDLTLLAEIYAAREKNTLGISSADLAKEIPGSLYFPTFDELLSYLRANAQPGDLILTVGAGDVYKAGENLVREGAE
jgi:UDP-N-acetylmuramate--alanine ligase